MSRPVRAPVLAGVAGGVGTSTLAAALHGRDAGRARDAGVDVLVCRGSEESLARAAALAERLARPVLAVTATGPVPGRSPLHGRLRALEARYGAVVLLPHVARWRDLADPLAEVAGLLAQPSEWLPRPMRPYVGALLDITAALLDSGRLGAPPPAPAPVQLPRPLPVRATVLTAPVALRAPIPVRPVPVAATPLVVPTPITPLEPAPSAAPIRRSVLWRGLHPVERHLAHPSTHEAGELDDEALEAIAPMATRAG